MTPDAGRAKLESALDYCQDQWVTAHGVFTDEDWDFWWDAGEVIAGILRKWRQPWQP